MFIQRRVDPFSWDPWFGGFRGWNELFQDQARNQRHRASVRSSITEEEEQFLLRLELPGFNQNDVRVDFDAGVLTVSAERKSEKSEKPEKVENGSEAAVSRSFELGDAIDPEQITAEMKDGVLTVKLPKHARTKPRQITVRAA